MRAFLGLGANLGDPVAQFEAALRALVRRGVGVLRRSSLYRTIPIGPPQPDYVNAVVEVETALSPAGLLAAILEIERSLGRRREARWGPRLLDIDILLCEGIVVHEPGLDVPHAELKARAFVLVPLAEIDPSAVHPELGRTAAQLRDELGEPSLRDVRRLDIAWPGTLGSLPDETARDPRPGQHPGVHRPRSGQG